VYSPSKRVSLKSEFRQITTLKAKQNLDYKLAVESYNILENHQEALIVHKFSKKQVMYYVVVAHWIKGFYCRIRR
jgi:hypothetical protein